MDKEWNYCYSGLRKYVLEHSVSSRFSLISALVDINGFVDFEDLQAVTCLYEEGYLEECDY